jgi:hAT family C-terminal dimerisation region
MEKYYEKRPRTDPAQPPLTPFDADGECTSAKVLSSEYDRYRQSLLETGDGEGWSSELRRYLNDRPGNVTKETDIVKWWQDHVALFPTLARIALDILPCQASSVPCERLFSASKQTADLRRSSLGAKRFEELQIMKFAWRKKIPDHAEQNWARVEEVQLGEYTEFLDADETSAEWDRQIVEADEFILETSD